MTTYTFTPPDEERHHPGVRDAVLSKFSTYRQGLSVVVSEPGVYVTREYVQPLLGWVEGVDYFVGGHVYDVSQEVADDLIASGYSLTVNS